MAKVKTSTGFECEPDEGFREDWEYFEAIEGLTEGKVTAYTKLARLMLTTADLAALKKHCTEDGVVSAGRMCSEILDILKLTPSGKNS